MRRRCGCWAEGCVVIVSVSVLVDAQQRKQQKGSWNVRVVLSFFFSLFFSLRGQSGRHVVNYLDHHTPHRDALPSSTPQCPYSHLFGLRPLESGYR